MNDVSGLPARRAALHLLDAVLRRGETLDIAFPRATARLRGADASLVRAIASEVLRWQVDFDALIDSATKQRLPDDAKARSVLRMMLAQALRLETAPHAVIATALPLLTGGPRRLAHGVFSTLVRENAKLPPAPSLPHLFGERWGQAWPDRASAIAAALAEPPPLDLTLRDPDATDKSVEMLGAVALAPGRLRLPRGRAVEDLPGFAEGTWWVQDFAASLPAAMLGQGEGRTVLDLCAAPGGKTLQLAAAGWQVTALDASKRRLERLRENLERTGLTAEIVVADALEWDAPQRFDAVLLDAPCSATGTCRRHPDVLHRVSVSLIEELAELQRALLLRAAGWLKPGGRLVYAVCSLEPEEGEGLIEGLDATFPLAADPIRASELPAPLTPSPQGWLRTDPGMMANQGGLDGFFAARFIAPEA